MSVTASAVRALAIGDPTTSYLLQSLAWCIAIFLVFAPSRYGATAAACDRTVSDPMLLTVHGEGSLSVQMPIGGRKRRPKPEG